MYYASGYSDIVGRMAEESMNAAVDEVKALPAYAENGEVRRNTILVKVCFCLVSGSLLTPGMTPLLMPTTLLCLVSLEGTYDY